MPDTPSCPRHPATERRDAGLSAAPREPSRHTERRAAAAAVADRWPGQFAQALAEALAGSRSAGQLTPWTTVQARRKISQLRPQLASDQRPRVRRVLTSVPRAGVVEMTVVMGIGPRTRALAIRLEQTDADGQRPGRAQWLCTAIESA